MGTNPIASGLISFDCGEWLYELPDCRLCRDSKEDGCVAKVGDDCKEQGVFLHWNLSHLKRHPLLDIMSVFF